MTSILTRRVDASGDRPAYPSGAAAVLALTFLLVRRRRVGKPEAAIFQRVNALPNILHVPVWVFMRGGALAAVPLAAGAALWTDRPRLALRLATAGTSSYCLAKAVKRTVGRGRPQDLLADVHVRGHAAGGHGYVSGHASVSMALASGYAALGPSPGRFAPTAALLVGAARMYVGAHLPLDVAGGAALGLLVDASIGRAIAGQTSGRPRASSVTLSTSARSWPLPISRSTAIDRS